MKLINRSMFFTLTASVLLAAGLGSGVAVGRGFRACRGCK